MEGDRWHVALHRDADESPSTGCSSGATHGSARTHQLIVIARDDDTTFGILHSRFHEAWSLRLCTWLGQGNDPALHPHHHVRDVPVPRRPVAGRARRGLRGRSARRGHRGRRGDRLAAKRDTWLNPPEWVEWVDEPAGDYPQHPVPRGEHAEEELKKRTLTNLYNTRPDWLTQAHQALDAAVADAYGWPPEIPEDAALRKLVELNNEILRPCVGHPQG